MTGPLSEDYLTDFARDQQVDAWTRQQRGEGRCTTRCRHVWHGVQCEAGSKNAPCPCPTSFQESA